MYDPYVAILTMSSISVGSPLCHTTWWETRDAVDTRHALYTQGLIRKHKVTQQYELTEKGEAWIEALIDVPFPTKEVMTVEKWVVRPA